MNPSFSLRKTSCLCFLGLSILSISVHNNFALIPIPISIYRMKNDKCPTNVHVGSKYADRGTKINKTLPLRAKTSSDTVESVNIVEKYFDAWNRRDMAAAVDCFTDNCSYEDTQYAGAFQGREELRKHLYRVSSALPKSFKFIIDDTAVDNKKKKIGVQWHVENNGKPLPFTRGCSFYQLNQEGVLISSGFDVPEPAPFKPGGVGLNLLSFASKLIEEPVRAIPTLCWILYIYIVFFSNGILPGADALQLDPNTWKEVLDLSINFFLVAPLLKLPFSPVVHPMLEGVFNFLLAWAALFVGFLSDDREDKPNTLPMLPIVVGMQLLTSAFYLPYLASRTSESSDPAVVVYKEDLSPIHATLGESRIIPPVLGMVGISSIVWFFLGRQDQFGSGFTERLDSFSTILSTDRLTSSFLVDLVIFGLFQGWLVSDDMKRRGISKEMDILQSFARFVPFFGLVAYFSFRPELPSKNQ